jgi:hypothetical protein
VRGAHPAPEHAAEDCDVGGGSRAREEERLETRRVFAEVYHALLGHGRPAQVGVDEQLSAHRCRRAERAVGDRGAAPELEIMKTASDREQLLHALV